MGFALVDVVVASQHAAKVGAKCMHLYGAPESTRFKGMQRILEYDQSHRIAEK